MKFHFEHYKIALESPYWENILNAYHEERAKGHIPIRDNTGPHWDWHLIAVCTKPHHSFIGCILWHELVFKTIWIAFSYVLPEYRRQGIYTQLYVELKSHAVGKGFLCIESGVQLTNTAMLAAAQRAGRTPVSNTYSDVIGKFLPTHITSYPITKKKEKTS